MKNILITITGLPTDTYSTMINIENLLTQFGHSVAMTNNREDVEEMVKKNDYTIFEVNSNGN